MTAWFSSHGLVDAHFGGNSSPAQDRRLWRHLPRCERCRARYRNHALLESLEPDNVERARVRLGRTLFQSRGHRRPWMIGLVLSAACAVLVVGIRRPDDRFRERGGMVAPSLAPSLAVFRIPPGQPPTRAGAVIQRGDALAFSYVNPRPDLRHLMVFAADDGGRIYWFWPAFLDAN